MILYYAVWWDPVCFRFRLNCPPKVLGALGLSEAITSSSSYRLAQRRIKGLWPVVANIFFGVNGLYMFMEGLPWAWALYRSWITVHEFQWVFKILLGFDFGSFHRALCLKKQFVDLCHWNLHTHCTRGVMISLINSCGVSTCIETAPFPRRRWVFRSWWEYMMLIFFLGAFVYYLEKFLEMLIEPELLYICTFILYIIIYVFQIILKKHW